MHVNDMSSGEVPEYFALEDNLYYASANETSTVGSIEAVVAIYTKLPVGFSVDEVGDLVREISEKVRRGKYIDLCVCLGASLTICHSSESGDCAWF